MGGFPSTTIRTYYRIGKEIGRGSFGQVRLGKSRLTSEKVAIKCVQKSALTKNEVQLLQKINHKNCMKLLQFVNSWNNYFYLITPFYNVGTLFDFVAKYNFIPEYESSVIISQLAQGLLYLKRNGIVHRDVKPENVMLRTNEFNQVIVVLIDFGLAQQLKPNEFCFGKTGSLAYLAPEVVEMQPYHYPVDCWSLGLILYTLLSGTMAFYQRDERVILEHIRRGKYEMKDDCWNRISDGAKNLIRGLLQVNPKDRLTPEDVLIHPWVRYYATLPVNSHQWTHGSPVRDLKMQNLSNNFAVKSQSMQT